MSVIHMIKPKLVNKILTYILERKLYMLTCGTSFTVINCLKHPPPRIHTGREKFRLRKSFPMCQQFKSKEDCIGQ